MSTEAIVFAMGFLSAWLPQILLYLWRLQQLPAPEQDEPAEVLARRLLRAAEREQDEPAGVAEELPNQKLARRLPRAAEREQSYAWALADERGAIHCDSECRYLRSSKERPQRRLFCELWKEQRKTCKGCVPR